MTSYVNVEKDARFCCHSAGGVLVAIGSKPVEVPDDVVAYLDSVPNVKRVGSEPPVSPAPSPDPDGGEEA
jgi:hypothetical protein